MSQRVMALALLLAVVAPAMAMAMAWSDDPQTPEGWAWTQIKSDGIADFNEHCGKTLDPHLPNGWDDACRQVSSQFLVDLVTVPRWRDQVARHGIRLRGARIVEDIDLSDSDIPFELWLKDSRIERGLNIADAHLRGMFLIDGSLVAGPLLGERLTTDSEFSAQDHASFAEEVNFSGAAFGNDLGLETAGFAAALYLDGMHVRGSLYMGDRATYAGDVDMSGTIVDSDVHLAASVFSQQLDASGMDIRGNLSMADHASFANDVILSGTRVGGNMTMETATFAKWLNASLLNAQGMTLLDHATFAGGVSLLAARIAGDLNMNGASVGGLLNANGADVEGAIFMRDHGSFAGEVNLIGAKVGTNLEMDTSFFGGSIQAIGIDVHGRVLMRDHATFAGDVGLNGAKLGWLDLESSTFSDIDLSDIAGAPGSELILTGVSWRCRQVPGAEASAAVLTWPLGDPSWQTARCPGGDVALPAIRFRNAHFESFQDSIDAWPPRLDLEGLHYDRLGGINGVGRADMRQRTPEQWVDWLDRDRPYSSQPYTQLAAVLAAAGRRGTAEAVLFAGNERERNEAWSRPDVGSWNWFRHDFPNWLWQSFLAYVTGYGIGLYTFRVLWWVVGLTVLGAVVLWFSPYARRHNTAWRLGASLHRLLPIIELSAEFEDFFENKPEPHEPLKLHPWQMAFFAGIALAGWVLGVFLLAALGGLTQK